MPELALLYGAAALLGHIFSIWMSFRGGKGVATGGGVYLALAPAAVGIAAVVWLAVVFAFRIVSVGSLLAATLLPFLVWLTRGELDYVFWSTIPLVAFVFWSHRANIGRLLAGRELPARRGVGAPEADAGSDAGSGTGKT
jgi:glycerol-3-phosphate acyltransferase PlsY